MIDFDTSSPGPALAALGALLDRSLIQIADAAADARRFDRETIRTVSDVWDNNVFPLFCAATASTREDRERRARAALEWMAGLGAERRRAWMREQAAAAGHRLDELLPPARSYALGRDHRGRVIAPPVSVTAGTTASPTADYDLRSADVRYLRVERTGSRLDGHLQLAVAQAFLVPVDDTTSPEPALVDMWLRDITEVRFDSDDARGADLRHEADGVTVAIGARGTLRAATAELQPDDTYWYLSAAGRRADALTPPRGNEPPGLVPPQDGDLSATAEAAATVVRHAMWEIRLVRYPRHADDVAVRDFCRVFAGAGEAILAAGAHHASRDREAAFRALIKTWAGRGGPELVRWFAARLGDVADQPDLLAGIQAPDEAGTPAPAKAPGPPEAELRLAEYTSAHARYGTRHDASVLLHLALPPRPEAAETPEAPEDTPWRLRALHNTSPLRVHLRTEAFHGTSRPQVTVDDEARTFVMHDGALTITSKDRWNRDRDGR